MGLLPCVVRASAYCLIDPGRRHARLAVSQDRRGIVEGAGRCASLATGGWPWAQVAALEACCSVYLLRFAAPGAIFGSPSHLGGPSAIPEATGLQRTGVFWRGGG